MTRAASIALAGIVGTLSMPVSSRAQGRVAAAPALFEIRIGRLAPFVLAVDIDSSGVVRVPLRPILSVSGVPRAAGIADTLVTREVLARLLGARVEIDESTLVIAIQRSAPFPAERAASRRSAMSDDPRSTMNLSQRTRWIPRSGGASVDWHLIAVPSNDGTSVFGQTRTGFAVAGGDLTLDGYTQHDAHGGAHSWGDWTYGFVDPTSAVFREVRVGDLTGGNIYAPTLRGVSITNRQPFRRGFFDDVPFIPEVPAGWSYELSQGGALLDFGDDVVLPRTVAVPLQYGATPLELRLYAPGGALRVDPFMLLVPTTQLPRGRIEYDAVAGNCSTPDCRRIAYARADVGLTSMITVGLGGQVVSDSLRTVGMPIARVSYAPFNGWQFEGDYQPSVLQRARVAYSGPGWFAGGVEAGRSYSYLDALRTLSTTNGWYAGMNTSVRLPERAPWLPSTLLLRGWLDSDTAAVQSWRTELETVIRGNTAGIGYSEDEFSNRHRHIEAQTTLVRPWRSGALRHVPIVTAAAQLAGDSPWFVELGASIDLGRAGTLTVLGHGAADNASAISLTYAVATDVARLAIASRSDGRVSAGTVFDVSGAMAVDSRGAPLLSNSVSGSTAGVRGFVYYDENDDGVFDAGDRVAGEVRATVGGQSAVTDHEGRFRVWNVIAYEPLDVRVDSITGIDPAFSQVPAVLTRATPNIFNPVTIRLARVHEISGHVELDGIAAPGGIRVLLERPNGDVVQQVVTFADGTYVFDRVFTGDYRLRVDAGALNALGARGDTIAVHAPSMAQATLRLYTRGS